MSKDLSFRDRIAAVENAQSNNFLELVKAAGLDREASFRFARLNGQDFSGCDLSGFDFTGASLIGSKFEGAKIAETLFSRTEVDFAELRRAADWTQEQEDHLRRDLERRKPAVLWRFEAHEGAVLGVVACANGQIVSLGADGTARRWADHGKLTAEVPVEFGSPIAGMFQSDRDAVVMWCRDGRAFRWDAIGGGVSQILGALDSGLPVTCRPQNDGSIISWSERSIRISKGSAVVRRIAPDKDIRGVCVTRYGQTFSWGSSRNISVLNQGAGGVGLWQGHLRSVRGLTETSGGEILSWAEDGRLIRWSDTGWPVAQFNEHRGPVLGAITLPDGGVVSWGEDNTLRVWSSNGLPYSNSGVHSATIEGALALRNRWIVSWDRRQQFRTWNWQGELQKVSMRTPYRIEGVRELPDSSVLIWGKHPEFRVWDPAWRTLDELVGHAAPLNGVIPLTDGRLASFCTEGNIAVWLR